MVRVGSAAPRFDCGTVIDGRPVSLAWPELHDGKTLALLFDLCDGPGPPRGYLAELSDARGRLELLDARAAVVCRRDPFAPANRLLARRPALAFPLILDADGRIARLYDLPADGPAAVWARFLIDPSGVVREMAVSCAPVCVGVEELIRGIWASRFPVADGV
jgi:hypothetical protein